MYFMHFFTDQYGGSGYYDELEYAKEDVEPETGLHTRADTSIHTETLVQAPAEKKVDLI